MATLLCNCCSKTQAVTPWDLWASRSLVPQLHGTSPDVRKLALKILQILLPVHARYGENSVIISITSVSFATTANESFQILPVMIWGCFIVQFGTRRLYWGVWCLTFWSAICEQLCPSDSFCRHVRTITGSGRTLKTKATCIKNGQRMAKMYCIKRHGKVDGRWIPVRVGYYNSFNCFTWWDGPTPRYGQGRGLPLQTVAQYARQGSGNRSELSPTRTHRGQATFSGPSLPPEDQAHSWLRPRYFSSLFQTFSNVSWWIYVQVPSLSQGDLKPDNATLTSNWRPIHSCSLQLKTLNSVMPDDAISVMVCHCIVDSCQVQLSTAKPRSAKYC